MASPSETAKDSKSERPIFSRPNKSANLSMGIVGLPNVGKSTLFNRLTNSSVAAENYLFCTIDPSRGQVRIEDERVKFLESVYKPKKTTFAQLTVVDIAGLIQGASENQGLGNQFLDHIRNVDGIFLVTRCFDDPDVVHVFQNSINPVRDVEVIRDELRLKDKEWMGKIIQRAEKELRAHPGNKKYLKDLETAKKLENILEEAWISERAYDDEEIAFINTLNMLTTKPVIILANIPAKYYKMGKGNKYYKALVDKYGKNVIPFSATCSESNDISEPLDPVFIKKIVNRAYDVLGLINFFTAGKDEVRSWTIRKGTKAPEAGAVIHNDFMRCFICAEVMEYETFTQNPSESQMRSIGKYLQKGKDYEVNDGDIIFFKQNASKSGKK